jgi:hypothetical protein
MNTNALRWIRTRDPNNQEAADLRLDRAATEIGFYTIRGAINYSIEPQPVL